MSPTARFVPYSFNTGSLAFLQFLQLAKYIHTSGALPHLALSLASLRSVHKYYIIRKFYPNSPYKIAGLLTLSSLTLLYPT